MMAAAGPAVTARSLPVGSELGVLTGARPLGPGGLIGVIAAGGVTCLLGPMIVFPVLVGGTEETHEKMTETAIKLNEKLAAAGKQLENVSREEFDDIAESVGLQKRSEPEDSS